MKKLDRDIVDQLRLETSTLSPTEESQFKQNIEIYEGLIRKMWGKYLSPEVRDSETGYQDRMIAMKPEDLVNFRDLWVRRGDRSQLTDAEVEKMSQQTAFRESGARYYSYVLFKKRFGREPHRIDPMDLKAITNYRKLIGRYGNQIHELFFTGKTSTVDSTQILGHFSKGVRSASLAKSYEVQKTKEKQTQNTILLGTAFRANELAAVKTGKEGLWRKLVNLLRRDRDRGSILDDTEQMTLAHELIHLHEPK